MIFFKKQEKPKSKQAAPSKKNLQEVAFERVLTAEGWNRENIQTEAAKKKKKKSSKQDDI